MNQVPFWGSPVSTPQPVLAHSDPGCDLAGITGKCAFVRIKRPGDQIVPDDVKQVARLPSCGWNPRGINGTFQQPVFALFLRLRVHRTDAQTCTATASDCIDEMLPVRQPHRPEHTL